MKVINKKSIKPELDDEAWAVAKFIQELGKVQDEYFERLLWRATDEEWYDPSPEKEDFKAFREWLFDYVFNSGAEDSSPVCLFSEYLPSTHKEM